MNKQYLNGHVLLTAPGIEVDAVCVDNLLAVMEQLGLDSACPLFPTYHRRRGLFECNRFLRYRTMGIELHKYFLKVKADVWAKFALFLINNSNRRTKRKC